MGSSSGESDHNVWSGFSLSQSTGSLGGGRADGSFPFLNFNGGNTITEPGSYEDFTYPSPFPSTSTATAYQFSPQSPPLPHSSTSWLPSFFSSPPPPPPPNSLPPLPNSQPPAPLLDQTEQSLFQTFLTTLDIDPQFLFNPVLPPGMPSPPSSNFLPANQDNYEREGREREVLGREVGGLELSDSQRSGREGGSGLPEGLSRNSSKNTVLSTSPPRRRPSIPTMNEEYSSTTTEGTTSNGKKQRVSKPPISSNTSTTDYIAYEDAIMSATSSHSLESDGDDSDYAETGSHSKTSTSLPKRSKRSRPISTQPSRRNSNSSSQSTTSSTLPPRASSSKPRPDSPPPLVIPSTSSTQSLQLTASEKRSNHIQSEQRRRNAIKLGFKDLVELVISGENLSQILLGSSASIPVESDSEEEGSGKKGKKKKGGKGGKGKGSGRGRGRKGDTGANAPKSVVLERSREYIEWLERGNRALMREVERVEKALLD